MQLTARLQQILPVVTGQGQNGEWRRQEFIVETDGQYPKKVCFSFFGDRINIAQYAPGTVLAVDFDLESRQGNSGGWFTTARAWKVEIAGAAGTAPQQGYGAPQPAYNAPQPAYGGAPQPAYSAPQPAYAPPQPAAPAGDPFAQTAAAASENPSDDLPF
ncbi:hypothetical protein AGMMS49965_05090 [Bacteroidia bacterium]|nr:hypothetical protein AGMMS49965_05090 [Bacteroidia bacterium]